MSDELDVIGANARQELRSYVGRIERLAEDAAAIRTDVKEVYAEAKGRGFDAATLRKAVAIRKKGRSKAEQEQALLDLYLGAIGMGEL